MASFANGSTWGVNQEEETVVEDDAISSASSSSATVSNPGEGLWEIPRTEL